MTIISSENHKT